MRHREYWLSDNFSLSSLCHSDMALALGINNEPGPAEIAALEILCRKVLEPLHAQYGDGLYLCSGYRCAELNRHVNGAPNSQHTRGEAVDVKVVGISQREVAIWAAAELQFDQLILEHHDAKRKFAGWCHISYTSARKNRGEILCWAPPSGAGGGGYQRGL